jgi:hypothetical protein
MVSLWCGMPSASPDLSRYEKDRTPLTEHPQPRKLGVFSVVVVVPA